MSHTDEFFQNLQSNLESTTFTSEMSSNKASKCRGDSLELGAVPGIVSRYRKEPKFTSDDKLCMT